MHGNETSGWYAVRELLKTVYQNPTHARPRSLSLFIANTEASKHGVRHMPNSPDYNRVWPGSELDHSPEHDLMQQVFNEMRKREVFVSVDIHNNTGLNPHYACVHKLDAQTLKLATLFGRTIVYFIRPVGVQSIAMSELCPAVTLECGKAEHSYGAEHALSYLNACVHLNELPNTPVPPHDIDLFHTTATVKVPDHMTFGYSSPELDLDLVSHLEKFNFQELEVGELFARTHSNASGSLNVTNEAGENVFDEYFELACGELRTRKPVMPSMLTNNLEVIRQDCLCYLMERYEYHV
ncbi:MAG: M14 family metallopeptidase [Arenicella sp.]|jgi:succinylglutamate desuccinylase|nr:M14 family metallopeptidase [Arenicella sp.]